MTLSEYMYEWDEEPFDVSEYKFYLPSYAYKFMYIIDQIRLGCLYKKSHDEREKINNFYDKIENTDRIYFGESDSILTKVCESYIKESKLNIHSLKMIDFVYYCEKKSNSEQIEKCNVYISITLLVNLKSNVKSKVVNLKVDPIILSNKLKKSIYEMSIIKWDLRGLITSRSKHNKELKEENENNMDNYKKYYLIKNKIGYMLAGMIFEFLP